MKPGRIFGDLLSRLPVLGRFFRNIQSRYRQFRLHNQEQKDHHCRDTTARHKRPFSLFFYYDLLPQSPVTMVTGSSAETRSDRKLVERIIAAYALSSAETKDLGGPIWSSITTKSKDVHDALISGDVLTVTDLLRYPARSNILYGFDMVFKENVHRKRVDPQAGKISAQLAHDNLVRLAETIGAIRTYLPEVDFQERAWNPEQLITSIEETVGFTLQFPNTIPEEYGIGSSRGVVCTRAVQALYQAWKLTQLKPFVQGEKTLEIGAGLGRTAFFANLFGLTDYTIIDLPLANVAQAYFLGTSLGEEQIVLHGEPDDGHSRIRVENPTWFHSTKNHFNIALNCDSMVEIGIEDVENYWRKLIQQADLFISMNHEAQSFRVTDLPKRLKVAPRSFRSLHPLRKGYVEELFFLADIPAVRTESFQG